MSNPDEKGGNDEANPEEDWKIQRDAQKHLADTAFRSGDYKSAIEGYTAALSLDPEFAVCLSNRSAAYLKNNEKSKALHDAQECVRLGTMKSKGHSRLAAALQSLGRHEQALINWKKVVKEDPNNGAAKNGVEVCQKELDKLKEKEREEEQARKKEKEEEKAAAETAKDDGDSLLDDFFDDVDTAASQVAKEKEMAIAAASQQIPTNAIKNSKKDLGTAGSQIERLLQTNYKWKNFNPFHVLDIPHTASKDDISKRYKALSLLLHPDKNTGNERVQLAYDEVLKAKQLLDDDNKANHCRQLAEQGMIVGQSEWEQKQRQRKAQKKGGGRDNDDDDTLESFQRKAILKIFADVEYKRREVEKRERDYDVREKQKEEEEEQKARDERKFDKNWKKDERVKTRIGNWRQFQVKKKSKH